MAPTSIPCSPDRVASRQSTSAGARYGESYSGECRTQATNSHAHRTRLPHVPVPRGVGAPSPRGRPAGSATATAAHHPVCGCCAFVALSAPPRSARRHSPAANPRLPLCVRCLRFRRLCLHACSCRAAAAARSGLSAALCLLPLVALAAGVVPSMIHRSHWLRTWTRRARACMHPAAPASAMPVVS